MFMHWRRWNNTKLSGRLITASLSTHDTIISFVPLIRHNSPLMLLFYLFFFVVIVVNHVNCGEASHVAGSLRRLVISRKSASLICWLALKREAGGCDLSLANCVWRINESVMIQIWDVAILHPGISFLYLFARFAFLTNRSGKNMNIHCRSDPEKSALSIFFAFVVVFFCLFLLRLAPDSFQVTVDPDHPSFSPLDRARRQTHFLLH